MYSHWSDTYGSLAKRRWPLGCFSNLCNASRVCVASSGVFHVKAWKRQKLRVASHSHPLLPPPGVGKATGKSDTGCVWLLRWSWGWHTKANWRTSRAGQWPRGQQWLCAALTWAAFLVWRRVTQERTYVLLVSECWWCCTPVHFIVYVCIGTVCKYIQYLCVRFDVCTIHTCHSHHCPLSSLMVLHCGTNVPCICPVLSIMGQQTLRLPYTYVCCVVLTVEELTFYRLTFQEQFAGVVSHINDKTPCQGLCLYRA